jgi:hypothetical protein
LRERKKSQKKKENMKKKNIHVSFLYFIENIYKKQKYGDKKIQMRKKNQKNPSKYIKTAKEKQRNTMMEKTDLTT